MKFVYSVLCSCMMYAVKLRWSMRWPVLMWPLLEMTFPLRVTSLQLHSTSNFITTIVTECTHIKGLYVHNVHTVIASQVCVDASQGPVIVWATTHYITDNRYGTDWICYRLSTLWTSEEQTTSQFTITDGLVGPDRTSQYNFTSKSGRPGGHTPFRGQWCGLEGGVWGWDS